MHHPDIETWNLDGYDFEDLAYNGSVIFIYRARQTSLDRRVAVYTLNPKYRKDEERRKALKMAAEITSQHQHPNIVPIIDFGHHNGIPYIIMQWMEGGNFLKDYISQTHGKNEQLSPALVASIVRQVGSAYDYLHSLDEVHGDPSTVSIVIDMLGNAYISDFIKRAMDETNHPILGLASYMAPERWLEKQSSSSSDQYALGVVAYEMITGRTPFHDASNITDLGNKHLTELPLPPSQFRPTLPEKVDRVLSKVLAKNPANRFATIMMFVREFQNAILDTPTRNVFISYCRRDSDYAKSLKTDLASNGFDVWIDEDKIEQGEKWFQQINDAICDCTCMVVIMTPEAESSEWVHKEILLAKRYNKSIFPILLDGIEFPILIDTQFEDVHEHRSMPGPSFYRRLSKTVYGGRY